MDPLTIGLLISSVIGTLITGFVGFRSNKATNRTNRDIANQTNQASALLAQQQHDWNIQDWQMQNQYDSPEAQMQRFRDAGLNPSLIYNQMSDGASINSTEQPNLAVPHLSSYVPPDFGAPFQNAAQSQLALAQARKTDIESDIMQQKLPEELRELRISNQRLQSEIDSINQQIKESSRRIQSMDIDDQLKTAQKIRLEFQSVLEDKQFNQTLKEWETNQRFINQKIKESKSVEARNYSVVDLNQQQLKEFIESWSYRLIGFDLDNQRVRSEINLTNQQWLNAQKDGILLGFQINAGQIEDIYNREQFGRLSGEYGWIKRFRADNDARLMRALKSLTGAGNLFLRIGR